MSISIEEIISETEKLYGNRSVMKLVDQRKVKIPVQRSGIPQLDLALGIGGLPKGRTVEIFGPESSGKTTLALTIIAQAQKEGAWAWVGDMEHALDPVWAERLGVDLNKLLISQPSSGEECLDLTQHFINTGVIDIVVVDSTASLVPRAELEGESGKMIIGLQARLMSQAMRKLTPTISKTQCIAIFINQIREKIGVRFGSPETTPGGRALKFYSTIRIDVRRIGAEKISDQIIGNKTRIRIVKNKVAPPFKACEATLLYENGFDLGYNLLEAGLSAEIFHRRGKTYFYGDKELGVGKKKTVQVLNTMDEDELDEIYKKIAGDVLKKSEEEMKSKKEIKLAKLYKKLEGTQNEEVKKKYRKRIKVLGGELPVAPV